MSKTYQPIVLLHANNIIEVLTETEFFLEYEIEDTSFAQDYLCEKLTQKFIEGTLVEDEPAFMEEEMDIFLREIVAGSILYELQRKGLVDSIEDEENEERFFLTDLGKQFAEEMKEKNKEEE